MNKRTKDILLILLLAFPIVVVLLEVIISYNIDRSNVINPTKKWGLLIYGICVVVQFFGLKNILQRNATGTAGQRNKVIVAVIVLSGIFVYAAGNEAYKFCYGRTVCNLIVDSLTSCSCYAVGNDDVLLCLIL